MLIVKIQIFKEINNKIEIVRELEFGKFGELARLKGDNITGHHMPSANYMKEKFGISNNESIALNLEQPLTGGRHRRTFTYGLKSGIKKDLYMDLMPIDALDFDLNDVRRILIEDSLYNEEVEQILKDYREFYIKTYPHIFEE